ncbi:MAG: hypothetical protein PHU71_02095 [Candidatus Gracilibacteria bacterium]|nr:hypothetical protein [Candidatus Gracilibacteria bacterium]
MKNVKTKKYALGLVTLLVAMTGLVLFVKDAPVLDVKASLVSYFELSTATTLSGSDNTATLSVGEADEIFVLLDTNTEYITAADVEILYDSTYLGVTNGSGSAVTSANVSTWTNAFTAVGAYSTNTVTATGSGSQINVSWGASTGETYQTSGTNDIFASFYVEGKAVTSSTTMRFDFTQGEDTTTDTDATRLSGTGSTTIDTLNDCYDLTFSVTSAIDVTLQKEADDTIYEYEDDDELEIDYTIDITNNNTSSVSLDLEDTIGDEIDEFFDELDSDDLEDIKTEMLDTLEIDPSTAASASDMDSDETDLDDGTLDIADISIAADDEVQVTYTLTLPDDLDLDSFDWDEDVRYGDDIYEEDIDTSGNDYDDEDEALGEPDGTWVSLGEDGEIEIELPAGIYLVNGSGDDLRVYEIDDPDVDEDMDDEEYVVSFSETCTSSYEEADNEESDTADFDLDDTNLEYARCIKITDQSDADGDAPGVDIDAIALLHVGKILNNTVTTTASNDESDTDSFELVVDLSVLFEELDDIDDGDGDDDDLPPPVPSSLSVICTPSVIPVEASATCLATYYDGTLATYMDASAVSTWTSSNTTIATVSGPQVTGVAAGTAYVTASYNGYTASALLTVTAASLPVTGATSGLLLALLSTIAIMLVHRMTLVRNKN